MRVLKVTQVYDPFLDKGGPTIMVRTIARELAKRGHRVTVLTADLGFRAGEGRSAVPERNSWGWRAERDGVEAIYLRGRPWYHTLTVNPGVIRFCRQRLEAFDLVHIYGLYDLLGPTVAFFCRRRAIPYVVEPMGMFRPIDRSFRLKRLWHALLGKAYLHHASLLIATSELEYKELVADGFSEQRLLMRYNGVDLKEFRDLPPRGAFRKRWRIPPAEPLLLFLGRLIPRKGIDLLIPAFAEACPDRGILVIAGPEGQPGYLQALRRSTQTHHLENRVVFPGPLFGDLKKEVLSDADVFVLPSRYENFANAAAEAIACSTPVIVSNCCGISELVDQQVGLVIPLDKQALVEAIVKILNDKPLYKRFKDTCSQVANQIGWERLIEPMETHYQQLLARRNERH